MTVLIFIGIFLVLPVWICVSQGHARNRNGWLWGLLLGWLGVIMIMLLPPRPPRVVRAARSSNPVFAPKSPDPPADPWEDMR